MYVNFWIILCLNILLINCPVFGQDCQSSIDEGIKNIKNGKKILVDKSLLNIDKSYPDHPLGRKYELFVSVGGKGLRTMVNSSVIAKQASEKIIQNCPDIGVITFDSNDGGYMLGIVDGSVIEFKCTSNNPKWGQIECDHDI